MQIPKSFRVGTDEYTVRLAPTVRYGCALGRWDWARASISIATHRLGKPRGNVEMSHSFWHEAVHAILYDMDERMLCHNEMFVNSFAKRLNQIVHTAKL